MSSRSMDGEAMLGVGGYAICMQCGEGTHYSDTVTRHTAQCPLRLRKPAPVAEADPEPQPERTPYRARYRRTDLYRLGPNGIEQVSK